MKLFDAHLHIIDPAFPLTANQGFLPEPFTAADYLGEAKGLGIAGGAVVSGSFQGFDQSYLLDALRTLGKGFAGVTQLPFDTPDEKILELDRAGVRAVRFNVNRGGSEGLSRLDYMARRVHELAGWHTELYISSNDLPEIMDTVVNLPRVSIDHLGLSKTGFRHLLFLAEKGVRVKATGFGRIDFDPGPAMKMIYSVNPEALMFGTDLPSTRAKRRFRKSDIERIADSLGEKAAEDVLYNNAYSWYKK